MVQPARRANEARTEFEAPAVDADFSPIPRDGVWLASVTYLAIVCHALADAGRAADLHRLLAPYNGRNLMVGTTVACFGAADTVLGMLAATLARRDDALHHFEAALAMNQAQRARPALARTRCHLARLLLAGAAPQDSARARELLLAARQDAAELCPPLYRRLEPTRSAGPAPGGRGKGNRADHGRAFSQPQHRGQPHSQRPRQDGLRQPHRSGCLRNSQPAGLRLRRIQMPHRSGVEDFSAQLRQRQLGCS